MYNPVEAEWRRNNRAQINARVRERRSLDPEGERRRWRAYWDGLTPEQRAKVQARKREYQMQNHEYYKALLREYRESRAAITSTKASNQGTRWSEAELAIALDTSRTETEAALMLGRSAKAVAIKRSKVRRQAATDIHAVNNGKPWAEADARIAADPGVTIADAAARLGRTIKSVGMKRTLMRQPSREHVAPRYSLLSMVQRQDAPRA